VNFVSFWDATRFANWLHNGQGNGDTENGAYTLTDDGIANNTVTRNAGWQWAVTSLNEWYKAAYFQPSNKGGSSDDYWFYPTSSNTIDTSKANWGAGANNTTPIGSYEANFYGTFDMAGNVSEWNEATTDPYTRGYRGGSFFYNPVYGNSGVNTRIEAWYENCDIGFRISAIPGPGTGAILSIGALGASCRRRSIRRRPSKD
jgi:formylglycine-generating enzyme required for sulfatase activity